MWFYKTTERNATLQTNRHFSGTSRKQWNSIFKALDKFGNCQTHLVYPNIHQDNKSVNFCICIQLVIKNEEKKNTHVALLCITLCAFGASKNPLAEVFYYLSEKLPLFKKLCYFRRSRFSQCFIYFNVSTALHCLFTN